MDKETNNQDNPSLLNPNNNNNNSSVKEDQSLKKLPYGSGGGGGGGGGNSDRLKRDEWSEGAVSSLLEAYEAKWVLRNRAKLKGHDWEEVAKYVSARANNTKSAKTQTQCKNKIESMKKRYRSESANADGSSWLLYPRLHLLLRGSTAAVAATSTPQQQPSPPPTHQPANSPLMLLEPEPSPAAPQPPPHPAAAAAAAAAAPPLHHQPQTGTTQNSHGSNGVDHRTAKEDGVSADKKDMDTNSSTPAVYSDKERLRSKKLKMKMEKKKRQKREEWEIAESIRWLAEVVGRSEQARMETMREIEKMRAEAEAKRGELDLKRTEIIANTQLEIAKLFAAHYGKGVDSSLRIGRN